MNARTPLTAELSERTVTLTRDFNAPRDLVFRAWTETALISQWWGPHGFTTEAVQCDLRVGGRYHFIMRDGDGNAYPVQGVFTEISAPDRLVMTDDCSCMPAEWLAEYAADQIARGESIDNISTLTLHDLGDGRTRMVLSMLCINNRLRDGLVAAGMNEGWGESFEKLDRVLDPS